MLKKIAKFATAWIALAILVTTLAAFPALAACLLAAAGISILSLVIWDIVNC